MIEWFMISSYLVIRVEYVIHNNNWNIDYIYARLGETNIAHDFIPCVLVIDINVCLLVSTGLGAVYISEGYSLSNGHKKMVITGSKNRVRCVCPDVARGDTAASNRCAAHSHSVVPSGSRKNTT